MPVKKNMLGITPIYSCNFCNPFYLIYILFDAYVSMLNAIPQVLKHVHYHSYSESHVLALLYSIL